MAENKNLSSYQRLEEKNVSKNNAFVSANADAKHIFDAISEGKNRYLKASHLESVSYDPVWLDKIQDCLGDLGEIINNPKRVTKTVTDIVPVELAKKTGAESVRHLASHSQYVKDIDEEGNITPNKILNIGADDDFITYENRFIATLVKKLVIFVEKRYDFVIKYAPLKHIETLRIKSESVIDGSKVEIESKVQITKSAPEATPGESAAYIKRINLVRKYLRYYLGSDFMKMFKNEKNVKGNILQTNIIRKNPKYNKCYRLYRYIESYDTFGIDYAVDENYAELSEEEIHNINYAFFNSFLALNPSEASVMKLARSKRYKPKVLNTIDDDVFGYMPFSNKPIEFIRVDDDYYKSEQSHIGQFEEHPVAGAVAEYEDSESRKQRELDKKIAKKNALLKRKEKEQNRFRGEQRRLILELLEAENESQQKLLEDLYHRESAKIDEARRKLWEAGFDTKQYEFDEEVLMEERRKLQEAGLLYVDEDAQQNQDGALADKLKELQTQDIYGSTLVEECSMEDYFQEMEESEKEVMPYHDEEHPLEEETFAQEEQEESQEITENQEEQVQEETSATQNQEKVTEELPAYTEETHAQESTPVATEMSLDVREEESARKSQDGLPGVGVLITPNVDDVPRGEELPVNFKDILTQGLVVARVQTYSSYITAFSIPQSSYMSLNMQALTSGLLPSREKILLNHLSTKHR